MSAHRDALQAEAEAAAQHHAAAGRCMEEMAARLAFAEERKADLVAAYWPVIAKVRLQEASRMGEQWRSWQQYSRLARPAFPGAHFFRAPCACTCMPMQQGLQGCCSAAG